ncbi:MAG: hypothetical protein AAF849_24445 [Bacteroidota bacterium]
MEELKIIWDKLNDLQEEVERLMPSDSIQSLVQTVEKHEQARQALLKKTSWMLIASFISMIAIIISTNYLIGQNTTTLQWIGFGCVGIGMFYFVYAFQRNLLQLNFSENSSDFVRKAIQKYQNRAVFIILNPLIYGFFLGCGILLILLDYLYLIEGYQGIIGAATGILLAIVCTGLAFEKRRYQRQEKVWLEKLKKFELQ